MLNLSKKDLFTFYLRWFEPDQNSTVQEWLAEIRQAITTHTKEFSILLDGIEENPLTTTAYYSRISLIALLISRHFEACIIGLLCDKWKIFDKLYNEPIEEKNIEGIREERVNWFLYLLNQNYTSVFYWYNQPIARILEPWEKRLWLEESRLIQKTPHTIEKSDDEMDNQFSRSYTAKNRLHLSIDPNAPPETIAKAVSAIVTREQELTRREIETSWADHGPDMAALEVKKHQAGFDLRRNATTGKNARSLHGTLSTWLRA